MFTLSLHNFRHFQKSVFDFRKINILIGENSSGKSSILKFLLALKQSLESPRESNLILNGQLVDLGNFKSAVYDNNLIKKIQFSFSLNPKKQETFRKDLIEMAIKFYPPTSINLEVLNKIISTNNNYVITFEQGRSLNKPSSIKTFIQNDSLGKIELVRNVEKKNQISTSYKSCLIKYSANDLVPPKVISDLEYEFTSFLTLVTPVSLLAQISKEFPQNAAEKFVQIGSLLITQNVIMDELLKLIYVNPIQSKPSRFYFKKDSKTTYLNNDIEKFINYFSENKSSSSSTKKIINKLEKALKISGIAKQVRLNTAENFPVIELQVNINGKWRNINDVGYGVSLQLPILFESVIADNVGGRTILIEQPEVHLHPRLQAKFIEALTIVCPKNKYIIETHSEHIIRKLQLLVKHKLILPEDVSIYYLRNSETKFIQSFHEIDEDGLLKTQFPNGFYDQSYSMTEELIGI